MVDVNVLKNDLKNRLKLIVTICWYYFEREPLYKWRLIP